MADDTTINPAEMKEVDFKNYCPLCHFEKIAEVKEPCNTCLCTSMRPGTNKPEKFKEKGRF